MNVCRHIQHLYKQFITQTEKHGQISQSYWRVGYGSKDQDPVTLENYSFRLYFMFEPLPLVLYPIVRLMPSEAQWN